MHSLPGRARPSRAALSLAFLATASIAATAAGQTDPQLEPKLDRLKQAAQSDPAISPELRDAIGDVADALAQSRGAAPSEPSALEQAFEKLRFLGDFRLRHESDLKLDDVPDRHRERLRLRIGAEYDVNDQLVVGARAVTGSGGDENSPHANLGATFDKLELNLDRAYATWRSPCLENGWITAGKFQHAFVTNPVFSEVVWDADVQPTGFAVGYRRRDVPVVGELELVAGEYIALDNASSSLDSAWGWVAQLTARQQLGEKTRLIESAGVYRWQDLAPDSSGRLLLESLGNATVDQNGDGVPDEFRSHFTVWNPIVTLEHTGLSQPIALSGEWIHNTRARIDDDTGYAVGCRVGRARDPGDWLVYYQWQVMGRDAVLATHTNDDLLFSTNYRAHLAGVKYQLLEKTELHLWGSAQTLDDRGATATTDSGRQQYRVRVDLNVRF